MKSGKPRQDVITLLNDLLRQAEDGEIDGITYVISTKTGDLMGLSGAYADRVQYCIYSVTQQLHALIEMACKSTGVGTTYSPTVSAPIATLDAEYLARIKNRPVLA